MKHSIVPDIDHNGPKAFGGPPLPALRAHETVLVKTRDVPSIADIKRKTLADGADGAGGQWLHDLVSSQLMRRNDLNRRRRAGEVCSDRDAETLSFSAVRNLKDLQRELDFPVTYKLQSDDGLSTRSVTTSAFALLTSSMAIADVNQAYEGVPTIGEQLVREMDDAAIHTEIGNVLDFGFHSATQLPKRLGETEEYREVGAGEERYTIRHFRDGYQRAFSQELIDLGGPRVFSELSDLGRCAREVIEMFTLRRVIDYDGSKASGAFDYVMNRNLAGAALFSATANTPSTRTPSGTRINNNALVDTASLETLRIRLAAMRNSAGFPVSNFPEVILVPDALWVTAWKMLTSAFQPAVFNEANFYGPQGPGGRIRLLSSPMIDILTTDTWWGGAPQKQFIRKWRLRPEIATLGGRGTEAFLRTREGFRVRLGWDMEVGVRDHVFWVECSPDTNGPAD